MRQPDPSSHPARQTFHTIACPIPQPNTIENVEHHTAAHSLVAVALQYGEVVDRIEHCRTLTQPDLLRHVAESTANLDPFGFVPRIKTVDSDGSGIETQDCGKAS